MLSIALLPLGVFHFGVIAEVPSHGNQIEQFDLGIRRNLFGDLTEKDLPGDFERMAWNYHSSLESYPTEIYFPEGKSDERFYINYEQSRTRGGFTLLYETIRDGKIHREWSEKLEPQAMTPFDIPELYQSKEGTITRMLRRRGLAFKKPPTGKIKTRLSAIEGYAGYWKVTALNGELAYWFTDRIGVRSKIYSISFDVPPGKPTPNVGLPYLPFPYPVTPEEKEAIASKSPSG